MGKGRSAVSARSPRLSDPCSKIGYRPVLQRRSSFMRPPGAVCCFRKQGLARAGRSCHPWHPVHGFRCHFSKKACHDLTGASQRPRFLSTTVERCTRRKEIPVPPRWIMNDETSSSSNRQNRREAVTQSHGPRVRARGRQATEGMNGLDQYLLLGTLVLFAGQPFCFGIRRG
jgi:hypothetical protein